MRTNKLKRAERRKEQAARMQARKQSQMRNPSGTSAYATKKKLQGKEPGWIGNEMSLQTSSGPIRPTEEHIQQRIVPTNKVLLRSGKFAHVVADRNSVKFI